MCSPLILHQAQGLSTSTLQASSRSVVHSSHVGGPEPSPTCSSNGPVFNADLEELHRCFISLHGGSEQHESSTLSPRYPDVPTGQSCIHISLGCLSSGPSPTGMSVFDRTLSACPHIKHVFHLCNARSCSAEVCRATTSYKQKSSLESATNMLGRAFLAALPTGTTQRGKYTGLDQTPDWYAKMSILNSAR